MGLMSGFIGHRDQYVLDVSFVEMLKPEQFALNMLQESCSNSVLLFRQESDPVGL